MNILLGRLLPFLQLLIAGSKQFSAGPTITVSRYQLAPKSRKFTLCEG